MPLNQNLVYVNYVGSILRHHGAPDGKAVLKRRHRCRFGVRLRKLLPCLEWSEMFPLLNDCRKEILVNEALSSTGLILAI